MPIVVPSGSLFRLSAPPKVMAMAASLSVLAPLRALLLVILSSTGVLQSVSAASQEDDPDLPAVVIDALDGFRWSTHEVVVAPGQRIIVTNRDVDRHAFTVEEWAIDVNLPTLQPVEIIVPADAGIGETITFYSSVGDDREEGLAGTIQVVTRDEILADADRGLRVAATIQDRITIEVRDDFTFTPSTLDVEPGAFLEIRNTGVIEHHFVVDEWGVNETIPSGDLALVQVPPEVPTGESVTFYCSVPGHAAQGMSGTLTIVPARTAVETVPRDGEGRTTAGKDLRPFVPNAAFLGPDWVQLRSGSSETLLEGDAAFAADIFPHEGLGAVYLGPEGSRVTLIVLPMTGEALPASQVQDAIAGVQNEMVLAWDRDRIGSAAVIDAPPPSGCDAALRSSGIVPVLTLPAGATACQLRNPGVAIFVTVEGSVGDATGVDAADIVIEHLLTQTEPVPPDPGEKSNNE